MFVALLSLAAGVAISLSPPVALDDNPSVDPASAKRGKVFQWKAADELPYEYYVPRSYDPKVGANLTVVLHGNGLDHRWTFWNHPAGKFRADDIVVSPDGTTYHQGLKNNEFLGERSDADRLHAFIEEMKTLFEVKKVFLYGHSQGSFFVFYYAGEYPKDVDGVCGHASGVWNWTKRAKSGHHQAIGFLHGTEDHIPYGQSWWGRKSYEEAGYDKVHLRTLWDWPHAPHHRQAEQVLAWCEAMVSDEPDRLEASLEVLSDYKIPMGVDWSALWAVASRLQEAKGASASQKKAAAKALDTVEQLATAHVAAIDKALGKKGRLDRLPESATEAVWIGMLTRFQEEFRGIPVEQQFARDHKKALESLGKEADKALTTFWKEESRDVPKAFEAGLKLLERGFTSSQMPKVIARMKGWADLGKASKIQPRSLVQFSKMAKVWEKGREDGVKAYTSRNAKAR